ncbi:MAG: hypothetical protein GW760_01885 [Legionella sp.]|nr:hypothetical protein [Legionella sp.]
MADFYQTPTLFTLSNICFDENKVFSHFFTQPVVIVIPCHFRHLENKAVFNLLNELKPINYITEIIVVVNGQVHPSDDVTYVLKSLDKKCTILYESSGNKPGKGLALCLGFSYLYKKYKNKAIVATLDADLKNFTPTLLLKLIYPMQTLKADFNKGYYTRYSDKKLDGRLTRLLIFPLLQALLLQKKNDELLLFLTEFRYPLSGDVAFKSHLIPQLDLASNWSYDLSLLVSVHKNKSCLNLFQTEITQNYQHPHRDLNHASDFGLMEVARDIIAYLLNTFPVDTELLAKNYELSGQCFVNKYEKLALFNNLFFSKKNEEQLIALIISEILSHSIA